MVSPACSVQNQVLQLVQLECRDPSWDRHPRMAKWTLPFAMVLAGLVCIVGPGNFLPKYLEGRTIFAWAGDHGLNELDLAGVSLIAGAAYVAWFRR